MNFNPLLEIFSTYHFKNSDKSMQKLIKLPVSLPLVCSTETSVNSDWICEKLRISTMWHHFETFLVMLSREILLLKITDCWTLDVVKVIKISPAILLKMNSKIFAKIRNINEHWKWPLGKELKKRKLLNSHTNYLIRLVPRVAILMSSQCSADVRQTICCIRV